MTIQYCIVCLDKVLLSGKAPMTTSPSSDFRRTYAPFAQAGSPPLA
ncbi:hypothetical protein L8C07_08975 [Paenibacillus sp. CMAA1739]|nr:hypothetical protein [Paenibacillus sp. CMAA1739]